MNSHTTRTAMEKIARQDWSGETVRQVLDAVGDPWDKHVFVDHKPGSLTATGFHFPGEGWLYIYVTDYRHMKRFSPERQWDLEAFMQETVDRVEFEGE